MNLAVRCLLLLLGSLLPCSQAVECNATSCGPPPPTAICPGIVPTIPRVVCKFDNSTKKCEWDVLPCPPFCNATSCGAPPPLAVCLGTNATLPRIKCTYHAKTKSCKWDVLPCPCNSVTCGTPPPVSVCPGYNKTTPRVHCSYNSTSKKCGWQVTPCCNATSCGQGKYCSSNGVCRANSTCGTVVDCVNPKNFYALSQNIELGCVYCLKCVRGHCNRVCTQCDKVCPAKVKDCSACTRLKECEQCQAYC